MLHSSSSASAFSHAHRAPAGLILAAAILLPAALHAAPRIHCAAPKLNFGKCLDSQPVKHAFVLSNTGDGPLTISHVKTCCGATASISSKQVPPGGETTVNVTLKLRGRKGSVKKSLYVASNDPQRPYYRLAIEGKVTRALRMTPASVDFGELTTNSTVTATVTLSADKGRDLAIAAISSSLPSISGSSEEAIGNARTLTVSTVPPLPAGKTDGSLTLTFKDPLLTPVAIPVSFQVPADLISVPTLIGYAPAVGTTPSAVNRYFAVKSSRGQPFTITDVTAPMVDVSYTLTRMSPSSYRVKLTCLPPDVSDIPTFVTVKTDLGGGASIAIPIIVKPR